MAPPGDQALQLPDDPVAGERSVGHQRQALPAIVIDHGQHPEPPAIRQRIADEIQAPAHVRCLRHQHWPPCPQGALSPAPAAHLKLLLAVEPPELLQVHHDPLALEHHVDAPIAEPPPLGGHRLHRRSGLRIIRPHAAIAHAGAIHGQDPARPALAHPVDLHDMRHRLPLHTGRYLFCSDILQDRVRH